MESKRNLKVGAMPVSEHKHRDAQVRVLLVPPARTLNDLQKCKNKPIIVRKYAGFSMGHWRSQHPHPLGTMVASRRATATIAPSDLSHGKTRERDFSEKWVIIKKRKNKPTI